MTRGDSNELSVTTGRGSERRGKVKLSLDVHEANESLAVMQSDGKQAGRLT